MQRAFVLLLALSACGGNEPITVVSFNAGLAPGFVDGAASRTAPVAAVKAGASAFEYQLWPEGGQDTAPEPGCSEAELDKLIGCVETSCDEICPEYLDDCMLDNCAIKFINVSATCQGCVMANVGADVATVRQECAAHYPTYAFDGA